MIVFDTTALSLLWVPNAIAVSQRTKKPIPHAKERLDALIEQVAATEDVIIIPAPVLSEVLVRIPDKADELLKRIRSSPWFRVEPFDVAAAVELALRTANALGAGDKKESMRSDWTKIKFDRQIVSIALVCQAAEIISEDSDIAAIGQRWNFPVRSIEDLPIPPALVPPPLLQFMASESDNDGES